MALLTTVAAGLGAAKAIADNLKFSNGSGLVNGVALAGSDTYDTSDIQDVDLEKNKDDDVTDIIKHSILAKANGPDEDDSNPRQVKDVPDLDPIQRGAFSSVFETEPKSEPVYSSDESPEETPTSSSSETNNGDGPGTDSDIKATMKDTGSDSSGSFGNGLVMGSPSSVNSVNEVASPGALAIPPSTQVPQLQVKEEVENPLLNEAQEAYDNDKDIDADELDYTKDEEAAEQVEDYVEAVDSGELEEDKAEEELEKAAEDGEVEKDELDMNLVKTLAKFVFPDTAEGSEDGIHLGGKESYDAADIKDVSLSNDNSESDSSPDGGASGGPSFSSSVGSVSSGSSSKGADFSSQESSAKSSVGSNKSLNSNPSGSSSSSSGSSSSGSMKSTFDKIMAGGIDSKTSGGDSSFEDSGMSGGNVGSVEVKGNDEPLKIATQNGNIPQNAVSPKANPVTDAIHEVVSKDWEKWPERDGIHYKTKGSIGIFTENGEDVFVKMGKSKIQPLEEVDSNKLAFVEDIL